MTQTLTRSIDHLQQITQEYASYTQSRGGLGNVLGGTMGLIVVTAVWLLGASVATAVLTCGATLVWLAGKEVIRRRVYQAFGNARELWPAPQRQRHTVVVSLIAAVLVVFAGMVVVHVLTVRTPWSLAWPYLVFCLVTPWIAWRYLRTDHELMVGVFLLLASAVTAASFIPDRLVFTAIVPLYSVILILLGMKEHRQYQALAARLRATPGAGA